MGKIKSIADDGDLDSVRLKALQVLLKTLGLESYSDDAQQSKGWEETLMKAIREKGDGPPQLKGYAVNVPKIPETEAAKRAKEDELGKELYGK